MMEAPPKLDDKLIFIFTGDDLLIPREKLEKLGLKPGEQVGVGRLTDKLVPRKFSAEELERRRKILREVAGSWSEEDVEAFYKWRNEMWATWNTRDWS